MNERDQLMPTMLLPQLTPMTASQLYERLMGEEGNGYRAGPFPAWLQEDAHRWVRYARLGGSPPLQEENQALKQLVTDIREHAGLHGYPALSESDRQHAEFDTRTAILLAEHPCLQTGEALRPEFWSYLCLIRLPDVVSWRFRGPPINRFLGGVRNALQRLWHRGRVLDRGKQHPRRWELIEKLTEDAMVQIFERASVVRSPWLARCLAEAWLEHANEHRRGGMEDLFRTVVKLVRLRNQVIDLAAMGEENCMEEVRDQFRVAAAQHFPAPRI